MGFWMRAGAWAVGMSATLTVLFHDSGDRYGHRLLAANIQKKDVPISEQTRKHGAFEELFLLDRYDIRAWLVYVESPERASLVYGLFGELSDLHRIVKKFPDAVRIIAAFYESEQFSCNLRSQSQQAFEPLAHYLSLPIATNTTNGLYDTRKILRAMCALFKLREDGGHFVGQFSELPDGTLVQDSFGDFMRSTVRAEAVRRPIVEQTDIGRTGKEIQRLNTRGSKHPIVDFGAAFIKGIRWDIIQDTLAFYAQTKKMAPAVFHAGTLYGGLYLLRYDPGILSAGIAEWSAVKGKTLILLQFLGWTTISGIFIAIIVLPLLLYRFFRAIYFFLNSTLCTAVKHVRTILYP